MLKTRRAMRTLKFLIAALCFAVHAPAFSVDTPDVSLVSLISSPALFDGKVVRITGFLHFEYEGDAIYLHADDADYSIRKNGIAISFNDQQARMWSRWNDRYVTIEGQFVSSSKGHVDLWSGALQNITQVRQRPTHKNRNR